jgi:CheY-like chemotaxis protein
MKVNIRCVMLIDDNPDDNFFHERVIRNNHFTNCVIPKESARAALNYIKERSPSEEKIDIIFLDINMPGMNGWEFLEEYSKLDEELQQGIVVIMLTTSENAEDKKKAMKWGFTSDFKTKPLTKEMMEEIVNKYFPAS